LDFTNKFIRYFKNNMKVFNQTLIAFLILLSLGCSNEFDVAAPWKEIPVTYAILSAKDSFQYVRVEKAFLSATKGANEVAQIPDSLYYPEDAISVTLVKVGGNKTYNLTRVDGNLEGFPRKTGIFASSPNWLYKANTFGADSLVAGSEYKLVIKKTNDTKEFFGTTKIPGKFKYQTSPTVNLFLTEIGIDTGGVAKLDYRCDINAVYFNADMIVRYKEVDATTGAFLFRKEINWKMGRNVKRKENSIGAGDIYGGVINSPSFFRFLSDSLQPTGNFRYFEDFTLILEGGGREIELFLETLSANAGITGAEVVPSYSNMSEGFGIITSKNKLVTNRVRIINLEDVVEHPLVRPLNFKL
jgi:hypothetical protein